MPMHGGCTQPYTFLCASPEISLFCSMQCFTFLGDTGAQNKWRKSMLKQMTAFCCVHQCRFPYLYGPCVIYFPICLAKCLPASTGIDIYFCSGNVWAREAGPNCGREVVPFWTGETGSGWSGRFVPVVAKRLVPVVLGRPVPVGLGD